MKKQFLTLALAATVVMGGFAMAEAVPCNVGEAQKMPVAQEKAETCNLPKKEMRQKPTPEQMKAMMEKRAAEFNKAMGLSDEQIAKAKEIRANGHAKMKPLMEKKKAKFEEMRALEANSSMSVKAQDKKAEVLRSDIRKIDQQMRQIRRDNEKEFVSILNDEQKAKYNEIKEEGRKHYRQYHRPQGPENFGHRPPMRDHRYNPAPVKK